LLVPSTEYRANGETFYNPLTNAFMTWVKICGMTNLEDALTAVEAGADAVGFVFYEKSPRYVSVDAAREIVEKLPERVEKVGVFVPSDGRHCANVVAEVGLTGAQLYFSMEDGGDVTDLGATMFPEPVRVLVAVPMSFVLEDQKRIQQFTSDFARGAKDVRVGVVPPEGQLVTIVLDSGDLRVPGGTGKTFDWNKATPLAGAIRRGGANLVVAGGLTPGNVAEAIGILKAWGVDVASGVEARPGKKDPEKVRAFVKAVREVDRKIG
jgi:phosphoribosylanthranilate isomerase